MRSRRAAATPSPDNVRAITGRESIEVRACGKNLLDIPADLGPGLNATAVTVSDDKYTVEVTANGIAGQAQPIQPALQPRKTYTISSLM